MKLEVGQFVRTKDGIIAKVDYIDDNTIFFDKDLYRNYGDSIDFLEKDNLERIAKASYNIIDILEFGDYANGYYVSKIWEKDEITHYVNETPIKRKEREIVIQAPSYGGIEILKNKNIKSVIKHEQMEQMAYKVGE